jgi:hypothetical protein
MTSNHHRLLIRSGALGSEHKVNVSLCVLFSVGFRSRFRNW